MAHSRKTHLDPANLAQNQEQSITYIWGAGYLTAGHWACLFVFLMPCIVAIGLNTGIIVIIVSLTIVIIAKDTLAATLAFGSTFMYHNRVSHEERRRFGV